jgi:cobalt-zinc-cadmium resistance protein CzcA
MVSNAMLPLLYIFYPKTRLQSFIVLALLLFSLHTKAQQDSSKILSLDSAVLMALNNHPNSKMAALQVEAANVRQKGSIQISPTEFTWEHGQINSPVNDNSFLINQNLGSPFTHYQQSMLNKNEFELAQTSQKITQKQLVAWVKEAYFSWVYQISLINLIKEEIQLYEGVQNIVLLNSEEDDSLSLEKILIDVKYTDSQRNLLTAEEQLKIATNKLNRLIYSEERYTPADQELDLYSIQFPKDQSDKFYPYTFKNYIQQNVKQKEIELKLVKSKLSPEMSAGYFNQSIGPLKNLQGFQIGLAFPLWFVPQSAKIKEARINKDIALNEATLKTYELEQTIDDLKIKLDQQFINVIYFRENALKQAEMLIKLATIRLQRDEIEHSHFFQSISEAYKIKTEYLQAVLNYNIAAVELEYYLN